MMDREAYLAFLRQQYMPVAVLAEKNGGKVLRLRHRQLQRDLVLRLYEQPVAAYGQLKGICHENLPRIYEVQELSDGQAVLEEFLDGITVAQVLEGDTYTYTGAKRVLRQVCAALHTLHSMGIVHRDLKPQNVMITPNGTVKLIDLNVSRELDLGKQNDTQVLGTVGYAPPEQLGIGQSDPRTDLYAMGVLLNVMVTGNHPSCGLAKGRAGAIVKKCTAIAPESRYQSAKELWRAL